jgi:hypothetical protein
MHRCSESIAALAAALAKAQADLVNPEKTQVATIETDESRGSRYFRYAPLSSGLDIVRKTLGHHAIAVMQTTAIDDASETVNLTTVLAHSSGEWIASDWPVCSVADRATPHRMGAALTYARRYALFTLVGIAGEDDIDAPDLDTPRHPPRSEQRDNSGDGGLNGGVGPSYYAKKPNRGSAAVRKGSLRAVVVNPDQSRSLRDRLLCELAALESVEALTGWAHQNLSAKASLMTSDALDVEEAFQAKLGAVERTEVKAVGSSPRSRTPSQTIDRSRRSPGKKRTEPVDKSRLAIPEPRRVRDRDHVRYVAAQPCLVCGRRPADAHHLRFAQHSAVGRKVSDEFTVPLCRGHHRALHKTGDETKWWRETGIDPMVAARELWVATHFERLRSRPQEQITSTRAVMRPASPSAT